MASYLFDLGGSAWNPGETVNFAGRNPQEQSLRKTFQAQQHRRVTQTVKLLPRRDTNVSTKKFPLSSWRVPKPINCLADPMQSLLLRKPNTTVRERTAENIPHISIGNAIQKGKVDLVGGFIDYQACRENVFLPYLQDTQCHNEQKSY